jgi:hypothetical protein
LRFSQVRFPYTPVRLQRLRAFTASPESDYNLFAKAKALRAMLGKEQRTADNEESKHYESGSRRQEASLR